MRDSTYAPRANDNQIDAVPHLASKILLGIVTPPQLLQKRCVASWAAEGLAPLGMDPPTSFWVLTLLGFKDTQAVSQADHPCEATACEI
jgi:hypothetical protein